METVGQRIVSARNAIGMKRPELARIAGIPYSTLAGLEIGDQKDSTQLPAIAEALRVSVKWLQSGKGQRDASPDEPGEWSDIKAARQHAALGDGQDADEYAETHKLKFRAQSLQRKKLRPDRLQVVYGKGDSMAPRIKNGDAILFDTSDTEPRDGAIFVVSYDRQLMAKRLSLLGGRWFIESDNRDDPKWRKPQPIDEHKHFEILGRVRWIGSWED